MTVLLWRCCGAVGVGGGVGGDGGVAVRGVGVGVGVGVDGGCRSGCLLYTSPSPRDKRQSRMPSSA